MFVIGLDFDGTCVKHEYPAVGQDIGAIPWLKAFTEAGAKLVLNTMRDGKNLEEAVQWFKNNNISLYGINRNPTQFWTRSPKVYAQCYVDDAAFGCPLKDGYVDWEKVGPALLVVIQAQELRIECKKKELKRSGKIPRAK